LTPNTSSFCSSPLTFNCQGPRGVLYTPQA